MTPRELALFIVDAALDKQAQSIELINVEGKVSYADFIIICSGRTTRQVEAIIHGVEGALRQRKIHPLGIEGRQNGQWVLLDAGDVVFHVFEDQKRGFYDLEGLWMDAERISVPDTTVLSRSKS